MVARFPRLAIGRTQVYVVGVDIQTFDDAHVRANPLAAWELDGESIGRPAGDFSFLFPRATVDAHDRLHLVWGEPTESAEPPPARRWMFQRPTSIWTAIYDPSAGWSKPRRLEHTETPTGLKWGARGGLDNLGGIRGLRGVIVPPFRPTTDDTVLYLTLSEDGTWTRRTIPVPASAAYITVAGADLWMFAAYAAAARTSAAMSPGLVHSDANSVFLRASEDGGRTWFGPVLVSRSGEFPAHQVHAMLGPSSRLHLLWKQTVPGGAVVRHVASKDAGATWSNPDDLAPNGQFENLRAVVDACDRVHLVYEDWHAGMDRVHVDHATWDGRWSSPAHLFADSLFAMTPDIQVTASGRPIAVFAARNVNEPSAGFATFYARLDD